MDNNQILVFNIVHGSFVDGYGIRTTIFLKGCPLECKWCCNPEGQASHLELKVTPGKCIGCGDCLPKCRFDAIHVNMKKESPELNVDREKCTNCGDCIEACYTGALDAFGVCYTVDELLEKVKKDQRFFRTSHGGVTIGGGEPAFHPDFTLDFLRKCSYNYIHTALDTCGFTTSPEGRKCLEEADLLLFDLKDMNPLRHRKNTGVSNERILQNLEYMNSIGKPIIIRIPIIPGYNDMEENSRAMAEFIATLASVERVDLIPMHEFGKVKYQQLGKKYDLRAPPISPERQQVILRLFESYGINTQIGG